MSGQIFYKIMSVIFIDTMDNQIEIWCDIAGFESKYLVSSFGRVKSIARIVSKKWKDKTVLKPVKERVLKPIRGVDGYLRVGLHEGGKIKVYAIHQLVARAFIPNPEKKKTVNHKLGIKDDNRVSELEWATHSEQGFHAFAVLGRKKIFGRTKEKAYWYGKGGPNHHSVGNKYALGKTGELAYASKKVKCSTLDIVFASRKEASIALGVSELSITNVCHNRQVGVKGLVFNYI